MKKIRFITIGIAVLMAVALFAGCATNSNETPGGTAQAGQENAEPAAAEEKEGLPTAQNAGEGISQELVIGEQFDLTSYDPADGMLDDTQILVYNGLIELDADFNQVAGLAESWKMSEDGLVWTFQLRQGVAFHDGTPWNAEAAAANIGRLQQKELLAAIESVETPDENTLVINMAQPTFTLASDLARTTNSMVSPSVMGEDSTLSAAVGTGPYKLASWTPESEYVFEANNDYWGGAPNLQKITFKVITDAQSRTMALESGGIDMMSGYQALAAIKQMIQDPAYQLITKTQNTSQAVFFNMESAPLDELAVRQAVGCAIDFDSLVTELLPGLASPPQSFFSPVFGDVVNPDVAMPEYDAIQAEALLDEAGWKKGEDGMRAKSGTPLAFTLTYSADNTEDSLLCPAIKDYLAAVGMDVTLNAVEGGAVWDLQVEKEYDMLMTNQSFIPTDDPTMNYQSGYWHSGSYCKVYTSPELDAMIDELVVTMDAEKRRQLHWDIQTEIMEQAPMLIAFHRNSVRLTRPSVTNFDIGAGSWQVNYALKDTVIK
ncbi:ABC transporter substrate-binding protein [Christensenellaceae bacterium OttesenSCG-928-K19]|nr:ABC transporter substrate-binding protein [Christensenellaceae bacterium OttesenSCG-928-K19]